MNKSVSCLGLVLAAGLLVAPLGAQVLRYEITGSLQSYHSDDVSLPPTDALNNAVHSTFPQGMPFRLSFSIDPSKGVVVENTATTLRYNRDTLKTFITAGDFLIGTEASPTYVGTFTTGSSGSFSVEINDRSADAGGDLFHIELYNRNSSSYVQTQVFGADLAPGARPLGLVLHLAATNPNAITNLAIPTFLDPAMFTPTDNAVKFVFGNIFPNDNYVGGSVSSITISPAAIPEPTTSAAISVGLVSLFLGNQRRKRADRVRAKA